MSLIVFNGSPRGKNSNSNIITNWFLEGYNNSNAPVRYLNKADSHDDLAKEMTAYKKIVFVFPLYVDGMPGQVKHFFEMLDSYKKDLQGKNVTYIIHCGFSEAIHCRNLEKYLIRYSSIMGFKNYGVVVIPGSEGFKVMPSSMTKKKRFATTRLGSEFNSSKPYNLSDLKILSGKEKMSKTDILVFSVLSKIGLTNMYWNSSLKKNKVFDKRFDAPYE